MKKWMALAGLMALFASHPAFADEQKLDRILQQEEEILKKLDEIKAELEIVKVRATLNS